MYDWLPFTHEQLLDPSACYRNLPYASHMRWRMHAEQIRMKLPVANFVADIAAPGLAYQGSQSVDLRTHSAHRSRAKNSYQLRCRRCSAASVPTILSAIIKRTASVLAKGSSGAENRTLHLATVRLRNSCCCAKQRHRCNRRRNVRVYEPIGSWRGLGA